MRSQPQRAAASGRTRGAVVRAGQGDGVNVRPCQHSARIRVRAFQPASSQGGNSVAGGRHARGRAHQAALEACAGGSSGGGLRMQAQLASVRQVLP